MDVWKFKEILFFCRELASQSNQPCSVQVKDTHLEYTSLLFLRKDERISVIIKGGKGKSACNGDSGGPLVCQGRDDKWYQVSLNQFIKFF